MRGSRQIRFVTCMLVIVLAVLPLTGCAGGGADDILTPQGQAAADGASADEPAASKDATATDDGAQAGVDVTSDQEPAVVPVAHPSRWSEISDLVSRGARLLCVDSKADYDAEHVTGASSLPVASIDTASAGWSKSSPVVLTSSAEEVSRSAASHLARAGFTNVYYLEGGYDAWSGTFEGTDARSSTVPARLHYIYTSDSNSVVVLRGGSATSIVEASTDLAGSMDALEDEFSGSVEVETLDAKSDIGRIRSLVQAHDVPLVNMGGIEYLATPCWILVDRDGRVEYLDAFYLNTVTSAVYGWCVDQAAVR